MGFPVQKIVVARHEENVLWTADYDNLFVVQKGVHLDNVGREPSSYVWYIVEHWDELEGYYVFSQGNPFDHCPHFKEQVHEIHRGFHWFDTKLGVLRCDLMGRPHDFVDIKRFLESIGIDYEEDHLLFKPNCLFKVSAERIKKRPKAFYENLLEVLLVDEKACYAFERCVGLIFDE